MALEQYRTEQRPDRCRPGHGRSLGDHHWGVTATGDTIVVGIVDDGTDLDHPDLGYNHWINHQEIPDNGI